VPRAPVESRPTGCAFHRRGALLTAREYAEKHRTGIVDLLRRLVSIDSRTGREGEIAAFLGEWLRGRGLEVRLESCKDRANVVAWSGTGEPTLVISGHLDTIHPLEGAWATDPWTPVEREGRLVGLGSSDVKAALAAGAYAALYHREAKLPGRLVLAYTIEEETTGDGTDAFVRGALASGFLDPRTTAAVVTEPTNLEHVSLGNRGSIFLVVKIRGAGGHGSRPHLARNPIAKALDLLAAIPALERGWMERYADADLGGVNVTPTCVRAGDLDKTNSIPEIATLVLDCRTTPALYEGGHANFRREFADFLARFAQQGFALEVEEEYPRAGHKLPADHVLARAALAVLREDLGVADARFVYTPAGNDAVYFGEAGIPTINKLGPGDPSQAHRGNESVEIEKVSLGALAYARLAERWLQQAAPVPRGG
jgi:acetylornithine deacetylase/succinyl-diaminopimelate desuccinylase-like protein